MNFLRALLYFMATLLIYLGIPLLGWGVADHAGYFSFLPRLGYALVVVAFSLAVAIQAFNSTEGIRGGKGEKGKIVVRQRLVRFCLVLSLYLALFFIPNFDRQNKFVFMGSNVLPWGGLISSCLGFTLVFYSGLTLGRQYSPEVTIQTGHQLITGGIYRYIRHPRYLGVILLSLGVSFLFRSWLGLTASLFFLGVLLYRIYDEETLLHREFGTQWEVYCQRTWRLIPFIF